MNLVRTRLGERFYNDLIGTQIDDSLFELQTTFDAENIQDDISLLLENFEPRVNNVICQVAFPPDTNDMNVAIRYDVTGLALPTQTIEFVLQSTRL
jgi:predicted component of type VI protein secretion system